MDEKEYCMADTKGDVFYLVLSMGSAKEMKEKLFYLHSRSIEILGLAKKTIIKFCPEESFISLNLFNGVHKIIPSQKDWLWIKMGQKSLVDKIIRKHDYLKNMQLKAA